MPENKLRPGEESDDADSWLDKTRLNEDVPQWADKTNAEARLFPEVAGSAGAAEEEGDDRTEVGRVPPPTAAEPGPVKPKLACTRGPFAGREFVINDDVAVIGRSTDNVICVPDSSISRRHARLRRDEAGWRVSDLKSERGTLLNGLPIGADVAVHEGDVLTLGETQIKLLTGWGPTAAPPADDQTGTMMQRTLPPPVLPAPAVKRPPARLRAGPKPTMAIKAPVFAEPKDLPTGPIAPNHRRGGLPSRTKAKRDAEVRRRRKMIFLWVSLGSALVMIPVFVSATTTVMKRRREAELEQVHQRAGDVFGEGKDLLRLGRWQEAKEAFAKARQLDGSYQVQDFLDRADREIFNQTLMERATAALDQNQLGQAAELLEKISSDTAQRAPLRALKRTMLERARSRLEKARSLATEGHADEALQGAQDVLRAFPQDADALQFRDQLLARKSR